VVSESAIASPGSGVSHGLWWRRLRKNKAAVLAYDVAVIGVMAVFKQVAPYLQVFLG